MNSSGQSPHIFGPLPQATYEASTRITLNNNSPPLYGNQHLQQQQQRQSYNNTNNGYGSSSGGGGVSQLNHQQRHNQQQQNYQQYRNSSIRWNQAGFSTSAERRLPFVHRFRGLPPPAGLPASQRGSTAQQDPAKLAAKMSNYESNPVGALQERFQSRGIVPTFQIIQSEGASHCPIFTFQVTIPDMTATGSGSSKKQAKHACARALLDKLDGRDSRAGTAANTSQNITPVASTTPTEDSASSSNEAPKPVPSEQGVGNPIGELQEYCVKNGLPMPIYDLGNVEGLPHKRSFVMIAKVGVVTMSGSGTSKKEAKKKAAGEMLEKLTSSGPVVAHALVFAGVGNAEQGVTGNGSNGSRSDPKEDELGDLKVETLTPRHSKHIQQFYKNLNVEASKLNKLQQTSLKSRSGNYTSMLTALGQEQKFEVKFLEIEEKTADGEAQCLAQLSTLPVAVCYGVGPDQTIAKHDAARNALNYLKIMTKRSVVVAPLPGAESESKAISKDQQQSRTHNGTIKK